MGKLVLFLLKEQGTTADKVNLRRVSHQSEVLKPKAQKFDHMLETLAWERDLDLSVQKGLNSSSQNLNLNSTQNTGDLNATASRPPSPPPPQIVVNEFPSPSSIPQRLTGARKPILRSELAELRSRPSFVDYEDLEVFRHARPLTRASNVWHPQPVRRASMMPVDADGYRDLLIDFDNNHHSNHRNNHSVISPGVSNSSIKSKTSDTTIC